MASHGLVCSRSLHESGGRGRAWRALGVRAVAAQSADGNLIVRGGARVPGRTHVEAPRSAPRGHRDLLHHPLARDVALSFRRFATCGRRGAISVFPYAADLMVVLRPALDRS